MTPEDLFQKWLEKTTAEYPVNDRSIGYLVRAAFMAGYEAGSEVKSQNTKVVGILLKGYFGNKQVYETFIPEAEIHDR